MKKLIKVSTKLLMFNDGCKESQNRAALFDMTLLMWVYMVQSSVF